MGRLGRRAVGGGLGGACLRLACLAGVFLTGVCLTGIAGGCNELRTTDPGATATEQFLQTQAAAAAVGRLSAATLRDRRVFVDARFLETPQKAYLTAAVRSHLLREGVRLVEEPEASEIVVELRSQGVGIDRLDAFVGLPSVLVPAETDSGGLGVDNLVTPEIAFYKRIEQRGYAAVAYTAYWRNGGELAGASGPSYGYTLRTDVWIFGIGPNTTGNVTTAEALDAEGLIGGRPGADGRNVSEAPAPGTPAAEGQEAGGGPEAGGT
jgi:hypothetical protein